MLLYFEVTYTNRDVKKQIINCKKLTELPFEVGTDGVRCFGTPPHHISSTGITYYKDRIWVNLNSFMSVYNKTYIDKDGNEKLMYIRYIEYIAKALGQIPSNLDIIYSEKLYEYINGEAEKLFLRTSI